MYLPDLRPCRCYVQAYLLFGDDAYLTMFTTTYVAAMRHLRRPDSPWLGDADMHVGEANAQPWISSLSAFWPGMQVGSFLGRLNGSRPMLQLVYKQYSVRAHVISIPHACGLLICAVRFTLQNGLI